jgi:antitoxin MazE
MLVSLIQIGNSKGIRIPKNIIDELMIEDKVEMKVHNDEIILKAAKKKARDGWEEAFVKMHSVDDDRLLIKDDFNNESFDWDW